jgi:hypothetical protein
MELRHHPLSVTTYINFKLLYHESSEDTSSVCNVII